MHQLYKFCENFVFSHEFSAYRSSFTPPDLLYFDSHNPDKIYLRNYLDNLSALPWICICPMGVELDIENSEKITVFQVRSLEVILSFMTGFKNLEFSYVFYCLSLMASELLLSNYLGKFPNDNYYSLEKFLEKLLTVKKKPKTRLLIIENSQILDSTKEGRLIKRQISLWQSKT